MAGDDAFFLHSLADVVADPNFVFVVLPFKNTLLFEAVIKPAVEEAGKRCDRGFYCKKADDLFRTGAIMAGIAEHIKRSSLVIADLTGRNANVFYELGIAHTLKKKVALLTETADDVPTDLRALVFYTYDLSTSSGIRKLREDIVEIVTSSALVRTPKYHHKDIVKIAARTANERLIEPDFVEFQAGTLSMWVNARDGLLERKGWRALLSCFRNEGTMVPIRVAPPDDGSDDELDNAPDAEADKDVVVQNRHVDYFSLKLHTHPEEHRFVADFSCAGSLGLRLCIPKPVGPGWHMLAVVWSRADGYIKFYVDAECAGTKLLTSWPQNTPRHCFLGAWPTRTPAQYADTQLGDVRVYEDALTYEEIHHLLEEGRKRVSELPQEGPDVGSEPA